MESDIPNWKFWVEIRLVTKKRRYNCNAFEVLLGISKTAMEERFLVHLFLFSAFSVWLRFLKRFLKRRRVELFAIGLTRRCKQANAPCRTAYLLTINKHHKHCILFSFLFLSSRFPGQASHGKKLLQILLCQVLKLKKFKLKKKRLWFKKECFMLNIFCSLSF